MASDNQADIFSESPTFSQDAGHLYFLLGAGYKTTGATAPAPAPGEPAESQESHDMYYGKATYGGHSDPQVGQQRPSPQGSNHSKTY